MKPLYRLPSPTLLAVGIAAFVAGLAPAKAGPIRAIADALRARADPTRFDAATGPTAIGHSHNDFAQDRPLDEALANGYSSIEVDVTDRAGGIAVVHIGFWTFGTLKEMYLDRLQKLVDEKGSVHGDGRKFTLWIEMRPFITSSAVVPMLRSLLDAYPMFAVFGKSGKVLRPGPVEAVLINNYARSFFSGRDTAPACLGTSGVDTTTAANEPFECWNYLRWTRYFQWDGKGEMPAGEVGRLKMLQRQAHARGLRTRFWNAPETPEFWTFARALPFDVVGTDHLKSTMDFLRGVAPRAPLAGTAAPPVNDRGMVQRSLSSAAE